ncbi:MAG: TraR/DksA family transcriptional regulator [Polyangia bacterium]
MKKRHHELDDEMLTTLRAQLNEEHGRLTDTVLTIGRDRSANAGRHDPGDAVDEATPKELDDINDTLLVRSRRELVSIEQALARMDAGTYGISERTGEPIPLARLRAIPWATEA